MPPPKLAPPLKFPPPPPTTPRRLLDVLVGIAAEALAKVTVWPWVTPERIWTQPPPTAPTVTRVGVGVVAVRTSMTAEPLFTPEMAEAGTRRVSSALATTTETVTLDPVAIEDGGSSTRIVAG